MCVLIFSTTSVWNISHYRKNWARYYQKCILGLYVKYRLLLLDFNDTWIYLTHFQQKYKKNQISWKSVQWEPSCSMRTDRQTWRSQWRLFAIRQGPWRTGSDFYEHLKQKDRTFSNFTDTETRSLQQISHIRRPFLPDSTVSHTTVSYCIYSPS